MKKEIFRFIKKGSYFLIFCFLFYIVFIWLWGFTLDTIDSGELNKRLEEAENIEKVDILVLGSSRAYRHYDPRIFKEEGYEIFVLGSSAQTIIQSEFLLRQYIEHLKPDLIIYDVYPNMFTSNGVESTLDIISNSNRNANFNTQELVRMHDRIKVWNYFFVYYLRELLPQISFHQQNRSRPEDKYVENGFLEKKSGTAEKENFRDNNIRITEPQKEAFNRLVRLVKNAKTDMLIFQSPMQDNKLESYKNLESIDSLLEAHGYKLYDFNKRLDLNDTIHFYDPLHLNQKGVEEFNIKAIEDLANIIGQKE